VNAVDEGMRLEPEHPSLAHLAFVAAIESYWMRLADDAPCDCRHGCMSVAVELGLKAAVAAARLVLKAGKSPPGGGGARGRSAPVLAEITA
jgi:hypothetical protein